MTMKTLKDKCRIAVVQAAPVMFDKTACVEKAVRLIHEAADAGAELVVFPELFIPCYPVGMTFGFRVGSRREDGREDWKRYYDNSCMADGPEMRLVIDAAKKRRVFVSIGYSERAPVGATLYNSNLFISPDGETVNHRKLKPTGSERGRGRGAAFADEDGDGVCDFFGTGCGRGRGQGAAFADEDGDGVCNSFGIRRGCGRGPGAAFADEDGDGVCDFFGTGCGRGREQRNR